MRKAFIDVRAFLENNTFASCGKDKFHVTFKVNPFETDMSTCSKHDANGLNFVLDYFEQTKEVLRKSRSGAPTGANFVPTDNF
jgi:hypothetical protein